MNEEMQNLILEITGVNKKVFENPVLKAIIEAQKNNSAKLAKGIMACKYYAGLKKDLQPKKEYYNYFLKNESEIKDKPQSLSLRIAYFVDTIDDYGIRLQLAELADMKKDAIEDKKIGKYNPFNDENLKDYAEKTLENFKIYSKNIENKKVDSILTTEKANTGLWAG